MKKNENWIKTLLHLALPWAKGIFPCIDFQMQFPIQHNLLPVVIAMKSIFFMYLSAHIPNELV